MADRPNKPLPETTLREVRPGGPPASGGGSGIPQVFRGWTIDRQFPAQGGEADVFLVSRQGEQRILKMFRFGIAPKKEVYDRLIAASDHTDSPIVRIFEFAFDEPSQCWFEFEEFIPEGSLADLVGKKAMTESDLLSILETLFRGLSGLHAAGILHLDLKPANVLVRTREPLVAVLSDFSISSEFDTALSKKLTAYKGTSLYQSPESIAGVVVPKTDWWSLGIVMLELLLGRHPLDGLPPQVVLYQITTRGIEIPDAISPRFRQLLKGLLTRDPEKRWGQAELSAWSAGKNVPVFYEEAAPAPGSDAAVQFAMQSSFQRLERPFQLAGTTCFSLEELFETAFARPDAWESGKAHLLRGDLEQWLESNGDATRAAQMHAQVAREGDGDLLFLTTGCFFHSGLSFSWRGYPCADEGLLADLGSVGSLSSERLQLIEGIFSGDIFRQYRKLTGKSLGKIEKLLKLAEGIQASSLKELPLARRSSLLLHLYRNDFVSDKALSVAQSAVEKNGDGEEILSFTSEKGFAEYARKTALWAQEDRNLWDLALKIHGSPWKGESRVLEVFFLNIDPISAAVRKDPALRRFLTKFLEKPEPEQAFLKDLFEVMRQHSFLEPLIRTAFEFPQDRGFDECLGSLRVCSSVRLKAETLRDLVYPPVLDRAARGMFLDQAQQKLVREILEGPEVLCKTNSFIGSWRDISTLGPFLTVEVAEIRSVEQLSKLKSEVLEITDNSKIIVSAELLLCCYCGFFVAEGIMPRSQVALVPLLVALGIFLVHLLERFPVFRRLLRLFGLNVGWEFSRSDSPNFGSSLNMIGLIVCPVLYLLMVFTAYVLR